MANTIERVLGWIAAVALVLAAAALVITYVPGARPWFDHVLAAIPRATPAPAIDDAQYALDQGDAAEANRIASAVVAANSSDAAVDDQAGNIAMKAGDAKTAERDYQLGEAADDKNPWNFVALGELYARQAKFPQADTQLRAALTITPNAQFLHYDLGVVELREGLASAALSDFDAELEKTPGYAPALEGRAEAFAAMGRTLDARAARMIALAKLKASPSPLPVPTPTASAQPSPSPSPSANPSPSPSPTANPSPSPTPTPTAAPSPTPTRKPKPVVKPHAKPSATIAPLQVAGIALPSPAAKPHKKPKVVAVATPVAQTATVNTPEPPKLPRSIADLATEAKGYLFEVAADPGFTRALPVVDTSESVAAIEAAIQKGTIDQVLSAGTAAMLEHHFALAQSAFAVATQRRQDWRGPFMAGINAQQRGDQAAARAFFTQAANYGAGPAVYVSLAVADVAEGADAEGLDNAKHALSLDPSYGPGLFTVGMIDLLMADAPAAERDLAAAANASGAPARTSYFLTALHEREDVTP